MSNEVYRIIDINIPGGLFGCAMTWILEILPFLKQHNITPEWFIHTEYYGYLFPHIIKSKKNINITAIYFNLQFMTLKKQYAFHYKGNFQLAHDMFFEYFELPTEIIQTVNKVADTFISKTLGIHYRGTDKFCGESTYISNHNFIENVYSFLIKNEEFRTIFITSDNYEFIEIFKQRFYNSKYSFIISDSAKGIDTPIHTSGNCTIEHAKEAIIDSLILSRCDYVIKTSSTLSDWAKIWNPSLEIYNLNTYNGDSFPQAFIPVTSYCL